MQLNRQLHLPPACQDPTEDHKDHFDSLIKDFHSSFVNMT